MSSAYTPDAVRRIWHTVGGVRSPLTGLKDQLPRQLHHGVLLVGTLVTIQAGRSICFTDCAVSLTDHYPMNWWVWKDSNLLTRGHGVTARCNAPTLPHTRSEQSLKTPPESNWLPGSSKRVAYAPMPLMIVTTRRSLVHCALARSLRAVSPEPPAFRFILCLGTQVCASESCG